MAGPVQKTIRYRFGPYELDPGESALSRNNTRLKLQELSFRLLLMLVERAGEVISREEVRQHLWPQNTFVDFDNSLGVAIRKVRDSLADDAEAPRYVETVPAAAIDLSLRLGSRLHTLTTPHFGLVRSPNSNATRRVRWPMSPNGRAFRQRM